MSVFEKWYIRSCLDSCWRASLLWGYCFLFCIHSSLVRFPLSHFLCCSVSGDFGPWWLWTKCIKIPFISPCLLVYLMTFASRMIPYIARKMWSLPRRRLRFQRSRCETSRFIICQQIRYLAQYIFAFDVDRQRFFSDGVDREKPLFWSSWRDWEGP